MATQTDNDERVKKLFVGGLKRDTSDEVLKEYFEAYGELSDCVVIRDSNTKTSRGFGYVTFSNKDSVIDVLKDKKEKGVHIIDGKEVEVKRAIPRDDQSSTGHLKTKKIFIGGLADEATADDIKQCLADKIRGTTPTSVDLIMKKNEDGTPSTKHRGFCFVEFEDEDIVDELCCIKKVNIAGKEVEIKKAEPKDKDKGAQGGRGGRGGGRGGYSGRGRGGGGGGGGDYGYGGYQQGYQSYGGYNDPSSYGYGYDAYGNGSYGSYGGMGMGAYQQAPSGYGPQGGYGQGGGGGRGRRYQPY
ncbi:hypothetical protein ACROYT_G003221 [Oculina patagonica]